MGNKNKQKRKSENEISDVNVKEELVSDVENELDHDDKNSIQGSVLKTFSSVHLCFSTFTFYSIKKKNHRIR